MRRIAYIVLHSDNQPDKRNYHYIVTKNNKEVICCRDDSEVIKNGSSLDEKSIHICVEGDFSKEFMEESQLRTIVGLLLEKILIYHLPLPRVMGHNESEILTFGRMKSKCPGNFFPLRKIRSELISRCNSYSV